MEPGAGSRSREIAHMPYVMSELTLPGPARNDGRRAGGRQLREPSVAPIYEEPAALPLGEGGPKACAAGGAAGPALGCRLGGQRPGSGDGGVEGEAGPGREQGWAGDQAWGRGHRRSSPRQLGTGRTPASHLTLWRAAWRCGQLPSAPPCSGPWDAQGGLCSVDGLPLLLSLLCVPASPVGWASFPYVLLYRPKAQGQPSQPPSWSSAVRPREGKGWRGLHGAWGHQGSVLSRAGSRGSCG